MQFYSWNYMELKMGIDMFDNKGIVQEWFSILNGLYIYISHYLNQFFYTANILEK